MAMLEKGYTQGVYGDVYKTTYVTLNGYGNVAVVTQRFFFYFLKLPYTMLLRLFPRLIPKNMKVFMKVLNFVIKKIQRSSHFYKILFIDKI